MASETRATDMSREKLPDTVKQLLGLVHHQAKVLTEPGIIVVEARLELELLTYLWEKIQAHVGYYRDKSFDLNANEQVWFRETEHYMKLLTLLCGEK